MPHKKCNKCNNSVANKKYKLWHERSNCLKDKIVTKGYVGKSGYVYANFNGRKDLKHRLVWEQHNGTIPYDNHIHHKDGNKLNNEINNLELCIPKEHSYKHRNARIPDWLIKNLYEGGLSAPEIGKKFGLAHSGIWYRLKIMGVELRIGGRG